MRPHAGEARVWPGLARALALALGADRSARPAPRQADGRRLPRRTTRILAPTVPPRQFYRRKQTPNLCPDDRPLHPALSPAHPAQPPTRQSAWSGRRQRFSPGARPRGVGGRAGGGTGGIGEGMVDRVGWRRTGAAGGGGDGLGANSGGGRAGPGGGEMLSSRREPMLLLSEWAGRLSSRTAG